MTPCEVVTPKNAEEDPPHEMTRPALLLAVARLILETQESEGAMAELVFRMVRDHVDVQILLAHRMEHDGSLRLVGDAGVPDELRDAAVRQQLAQVLCRTVAERREPLIADEAHAQCIGNEPAACFLQRLGMRAYACHPLLGRDGAVLGTLAVARRTGKAFATADVEFMQTLCHFLALAWDRRRTEEERHHREQEFDTLANHMNQLAWMARKDGHIDWYNRRWLDYTGTTLEEMRGSGWKRVHHPQHLARVAEKLERCFETGQPWEDTFPLRGRDGSYRWFLSRAVPIRDGSGAVVRWLGTNTDVTEQRAVEEKLLRREQELGTLVDNTPSILTRHDRQQRYVFVNAQFEQATGLGREQVLGRHMCDIGIAEEVCAKWQSAMRHVFEQGQPTRIEFDLEGPEGLRHFESRVVPELTAEGTVEYALGVTQDRTTEKRAEEVLLEADRRKDEFLATLAHELRNPLAPVRTGLQILRLSSGDGPAATKTLAMMERQIAHMVRLIDDLLDVSRISRGKLELKCERLALRPVLDSAIEASRPLIDASRHELRLHLPHEPLHVHGDPVRLAQVIGNLLNNAAKYTPDGGRIDLTVERRGGEAVIRVEDNGVGIAREMLSEVFEMFTQAGKSLDRAQGGLGIGLSIVKRLVEMHGGTIDADSPGPGLGAVFTVRLPLAQDPPPQGRGAGAGGGVPNAKSRRVLVVDDNEDAADSLAMMLELLGQDCRTVHGGPAALAAARELAPEIVFCDIGMPGMDGHEVAQRLREEAQGAPILLVALTGWGSEDDKRQALEAGFDIHLTKPVDVDTLQLLLTERRRRRP